MQLLHHDNEDLAVNFIERSTYKFKKKVKFMFIAQIMVCGFLSGQCVLLEDIKGPKFSLDKCKSIQQEIFNDEYKSFLLFILPDVEN